MARASTESAEPALDVDMTPLIDIVFLLLIFFMVVSTFKDMERSAEVQLPSAYGVIIEGQVDQGRLIINVENDGAIVVFKEKMKLAQLQRELVNYRRGRPAERATIIVRGDQECLYENIKDILSSIYEAGFEKIMFAAYQKEDE